MSKREGEVGDPHLATNLRQQFRQIGLRLDFAHIADERIYSVEHLRRGEAGRPITPDPLAAFPHLQEPGLNRRACTITIGVPLRRLHSTETSRKHVRGASC